MTTDSSQSSSRGALGDLIRSSAAGQAAALAPVLCNSGGCDLRHCRPSS